VLNRFVYLTAALTMLIAGCGTVEIGQEIPPTTTPDFVTATLPPTPSPAPTRTPPPPTPIPTMPPVDGRTTTQVNVRADTSTASESWGVIPQFTNVQVIGRDASGNWYQIIHDESPAGTGWVRAEFVQVNASAEITVIRPEAGAGYGVSGVIQQRINVRSGAGRTFEALGILNPGDVVVVIGRDTGGGWMQIEFAGASDGVGWVASEFISVEDADSLPIIAGEEIDETVDATPQASVQPAAQDGDTMQTPVAQVTLEPSGARAFQFSGEVSAPEGDTEDWIGFVSQTEKVAIEVQCSGGSLQVELWNNGRVTEGFSLACGEKRIWTITPGNAYHVRIFEQSDGEFRRTPYTLKIERINLP
jgi:uncharacterized protein YgiM (DUF1202 family)